MAVGAIAGVSLVVGAIGVFTMMWITVGERISEIGLLRALGATSREVNLLFLLEAVVLTVLGGVFPLTGSDQPGSQVERWNDCPWAMVAKMSSSHGMTRSSRASSQVTQRSSSNSAWSGRGWPPMTCASKSAVT